jgi:hypothetical protein
LLYPAAVAQVIVSEKAGNLILSADGQRKGRSCRLGLLARSVSGNMVLFHQSL